MIKRVLGQLTHPHLYNGAKGAVMLGGLVGVNIELSQGTKWHTQSMQIVPKQIAHLEKRPDTLGKCPLSSWITRMGIFGPN